MVYVEDNKPGFVTLDYVVRNAMLDVADTSSYAYQRFLQWAIRGVIDMGKFAIPKVKTIMVEMDDLKRVRIPEDYMHYSKIALCINTTTSGPQLLTLGLNDNLCLVRGKDKCGDDVKEVVASVSSDVNFLENYFAEGYYFSDYWQNGQFVGGQYSAGAGFSTGYYRIDKERGYIQFSSELANMPIVLEYISTGIEVDGGTTIPIQALECLLAWIHWKRIAQDPKVSRSEKRAAQVYYVACLHDLRRFERSFSAAEVLQALRAQYTRTPKM